MDQLSKRSPEHISSLRLHRAEHLEHPALSKCTNLRFLQFQLNDLAAIPKWVRANKRLRTLEITSYALKTLPKWISELEQLRVLSLDRCAEIKRVPPWLWELPRLESVRLFHTKVTKLDGIDKAPRLRSVVSYSDLEKGCGVLGESFPALAEELQSVAGITSAVVEGRSIPQLTLTRESSVKIPKGTTKAAAKKRAEMLESLPSGFDCSGIDLHGQTFEDLDLDLKLDGANLEGSVWRRCGLGRTSLIAASLKNAVFEDCEIKGEMDRIKGQGARFVGCELGSFEKANLTKARIEGTREDTRLRLSGANLKGAFVEAVYSTPKKGDYIDLENTNLCGAEVRVRLSDEAAARVAESGTKVRWKRGKLPGAKKDSKTVIEYTALGQKATKAVSGAIASSVGILCGANAACWFLVADARVARSWGGSQIDDDYNELPGTDFARAMARMHDFGTIEVGEGVGVLGDVGDGGCTDVWKVDDTYNLLHWYQGDDIEPKTKEGKKLVGARVAQLPAKETTTVGRFTVSCGALSLLLPYVADPFTGKQIASAVKSGKARGVKNDHHALLLPVPNGEYVVSEESLDHRDDIGHFVTRVCIAPAPSTSKKRAAKKKAAKKKSPAKKATAKKAPAKKGTAKKAPAKKKSATRKSTKKAATRRSTRAKGKSFLFTGKLASMNRAEAKERVKAIGGKSAASVKKDLDYLVIGDDGSPLFGQGKKGSKMLAAEKLIAKGAELQIISEADFLKLK